MKPSHSIFSMNDQHRATDSEWYCLKARTCGDKSDVVAYSCILELRNRIEALEASQPEHLIDPERERMAQEFMQAAGFAPRSSEGELRAAAQPAKSNHPGTPDSSLKERIKSRLIQSVGSTWEVTTASVLTEVAAWLDTVQKFDAAVLLRLEAEQ